MKTSGNPSFRGKIKTFSLPIVLVNNIAVILLQVQTGNKSKIPSTFYTNKIKRVVIETTHDRHQEAVALTGPALR